MIILTPRERVMLTFIQSYIKANGYAPTMKEIATSMGKVAGDGINYTLQKLEDKGVIHRTLKSGGKRERAIGLVRGVKIGIEP